MFVNNYIVLGIKCKLHGAMWHRVATPRSVVWILVADVNLAKFCSKRLLENLINTGCHSDRAKPKEKN